MPVFTQGDTLSIPANSEKTLYGLEMDWISIYDATGEILAFFNGRRSEEFWMNIGATYSRGPAEPIQLVTFVNRQSFTNVLRVNMGRGAFIDSRGSTPQTVVTPQTMTEVAHVTVGAGAAAQLLAFNADRVEAILSNLETNTGAVLVGGSGIGAGEGFELRAGISLALPGAYAIHAFNPTGSDVTIGIAEVTR